MSQNIIILPVFLQINMKVFTHLLFYIYKAIYMYSILEAFSLENKEELCSILSNGHLIDY